MQVSALAGALLVDLSSVLLMLVAGARVMVAEGRGRRLHLVVDDAAGGCCGMVLGPLLLLLAGLVSGEGGLGFALEVVVAVLLGTLLAPVS